MITHQDARHSVLKYLKWLEADERKLADLRKGLSPKEREVLGLGYKDEVLNLVIDDNNTITEDFGWVFFYQSSEYLKTEDFSKSLVGNAPIIVSNSDGTLHETGTAESIELYIENFKRCGDPHG